MLLNEATPPLSFERVARAKAAGCVVYALIIPVFACIGMLVVGILYTGLLHLLKLDAKTQEALTPILFFLLFGTLLACVFWGFRDYRRRAGNRVQVHDDRLERWWGANSDTYRFDEIDWIEGPSLTTLTLQDRNRRKLQLRAEEWPIDGIRSALVQRAIPNMVRGMNARLHAGEQLAFRPVNLLRLRLVAVGLAFFALAAYFVYRWGMPLPLEKRSAMQLALPVFLLVSGGTWLVRAVRATAGILVDRDGVRVRAHDPVIPWPRLRELTPSETGMLLEADDGTKIRIGALTRNYDACLSVLRTWMVTTE